MRFTRQLRSIPDNRWTLWIVLTLFLVALLIRSVFLVEVKGVDAALDGDEGGYHDPAVRLTRGDSLIDAVGSSRPPLLAVQLALVYSVTWPETGVGRWYMVLVSALAAPLVFMVARQLHPKPAAVPVLAGVGWALYPPAIWYSSLILTETMASLLAVAGVGLFVWSARARNPWIAGLTGLVWGLAALNRSSFLLFPFFLLACQLVLWRARPSVSWGWRQWLAALAALVVVMLPWTARNYVVHRAFIPVETRAGYGLLITNGTLTNPRIQAGEYFKNPELLRIGRQGGTEAERDSIMLRLAFDEIRRNWRLLPRPIVNRAKNFWTTRPDPYDPSWTRNDWIMLFVWAPVLVFFVTSSFVRSWKENWPALAVVLYVFLVTLAFWGTPRFRFPVDPILITGAAAGFVETLRWATSALQRRERHLVPGN